MDKFIYSFPMPSIPDVNLWSQLLSDAFIIALIAFSVSVSMGCLFARKHKYKIDSTQVSFYSFLIIYKFIYIQNVI